MASWPRLSGSDGKHARKQRELLRRAEIIVSQIVGCDENDAAKFVQRAEGDVKIAALLGLGWNKLTPLRH